MCLAVILTLWRAEIDCWTFRNILCEQILNSSVGLEVRILVESKMYMKVTFSREHYYKHADWKRIPCV